MKNENQLRESGGKLHMLLREYCGLPLAIFGSFTIAGALFIASAFGKEDVVFVAFAFLFIGNLAIDLRQIVQRQSARIKQLEEELSARRET